MGGDIEMAGMVMGAPRQAAQTAGVSLSVLITAEGEQKKGIWKEEIQEGLIMVSNKCTGEWLHRGVYLFRKPNFQLSHFLA